MRYRLAHAYVCLLFALEMLLFASSLLLHMSVLVGATQPFLVYGAMLYRGAIIVGVPITAFVRDGLKWPHQIKSCPKWMWRTAAILGVYCIAVAALQALLSGSPFFEAPVVESCLPLGFDAISLCVLGSVLWSHYLSSSELIKRAVSSLMMIGVCAILLLAYRAGNLHHPESY